MILIDLQNAFDTIDQSILLQIIYAGPISESKGMGVIFQKKGKEMLKRGKIFENLGKNVQNLKIF